MDDDINVPLLAGLLSALGTLLLGLLCIVLWFAITGDGRIQLGNGDPGSFDDESALMEEEADALELMDELSRTMYLQAKAFIEANPPNSANTDISLSQFMVIQEKGVAAWEFEVDFTNANCFVEARTEIEFFDSICSVQTNLPLPKQNEVYYWEAKIYDKPVSTAVSVGLTTKPYPTFRLPGYHRYSVAYDSEGLKRINQPFSAPHYGPPLQQGDVVGVGYRPRTGTVFFTRNGKKLEEALHGMRMNLFPTIGATGPATVVVNFGQAGFVFIEANVKKWGLAPAHGSLAPPPPYGAEQDYVLLETGLRGGGASSHHTPSSPSRHKGNYDRRINSQLASSQIASSSTSAASHDGDAHDDIERPPPSFEDVSGPSRPIASSNGQSSTPINNQSSTSIGSLISTISDQPPNTSPPNPYSLNNGASINLTRLPQRVSSSSPPASFTPPLPTPSSSSSTPLPPQSPQPIISPPPPVDAPAGPPAGRPPSYTSDNDTDDEDESDQSPSHRRRMSTRESILEATGDYITPESTPQP